MKPNYVLNAWRNKKQTLGAWVVVISINVAESMALSGFDWLVIDCQHGLIEMNALPALIAAINTTNTVPFVRVKSNNFGDINKALDSGALGVIVPMINNADFEPSNPTQTLAGMFLLLWGWFGFTGM